MYNSRRVRHIEALNDSYGPWGEKLAKSGVTLRPNMGDSPGHSITYYDPGSRIETSFMQRIDLMRYILSANVAGVTIAKMNGGGFEAVSSVDDITSGSVLAVFEPDGRYSRTNRSYSRRLIDQVKGLRDYKGVDNTALNWADRIPTGVLLSMHNRL